MTRITWSSQALDDLEAIAAYVRRDSIQYASMLLSKLIGAVERLGTYPFSGRSVPECADASLREVICGAYRIVYRLQGHEVTVITVHHAARLLRFD